MIVCTPQQLKQSRTVTALAIAALTYLAVATVSLKFAFIKCPFHVLTGFSCPGCGMTRSLTALLRGDLVASWGYHPFGFLFFFGAAGFTTFHVFRAIVKKTPPIPFVTPVRKYASQIWLGLLIGVVIHGGVRLTLEFLGILRPI